MAAPPIISIRVGNDVNYSHRRRYYEDNEDMEYTLIHNCIGSHTNCFSDSIAIQHSGLGGFPWVS